jgi:hypothetical protein
VGDRVSSQVGATGRDDDVRVIYLLASGRSGSTVMGNVLGEIEGFFHAGELRTLWGLGLQRNRLCGCGVPVPKCDVWGEIVRRTLDDAGLGVVAPPDVEHWHRQTMRLRNTRRLLRLPHGLPTGWPSLDRYAAVQASLYRAISDVTGSSTVIDSSKRPAEAAILKLLPGVDPYVVHLVRDPRAVVHSWRRHKHSPGEGPRQEMLEYTPFISARNWLWINSSGEALRRRWSAGRTMRLRYEDFVSSPRAQIRRILDLVGIGNVALPFMSERSVHLRTNHTAGGNPDRLIEGVIEIRHDLDWLHRQPVLERVLATTVALPLMSRYGYPLSPRRGRKEPDRREATDMKTRPTEREGSA